MKKLFNTLVCALAKIWFRNVGATVTIALLFVVVGGFSAYYIAESSYSIPTTEDLNQYSEIISQIASGHVQDIELPDDATVSELTAESITVTNNSNHYSVTGHLSKSGLTHYTHDSHLQEGLVFLSVFLGLVVGFLLWTLLSIFLINFYKGKPNKDSTQKKLLPVDNQN